jgi:protein SCO1/2
MTSFGRRPARGRERLLWGVLVGGLLVVFLLAVRSFFIPTPPALDRIGPVPPFAFIAQDGDSLESAELGGTVWMAGFMFTRCRGICPVLTAAMKSVQDRLADREGWALVSFSVDPVHDTPEVLREYARSHGADSRRWHFLTGDKAGIRDLSTKGFFLAVEDDAGTAAEPILHSQRIVLVDREGIIRGYYDSTSAADLDRLVADVNRLLGEPA